MRWQTREHQKYLGDTKIPRIRAGTVVPPGGVNLAYAFAELPSVAKNIKIVDIDEPGLGNTDYTEPMTMWPDRSNLLRNTIGECDIPGRRQLVTNVFKDGRPLFYKHRLKYAMFSQNPPDSLGFYQGGSIRVVNQYDVPSSARWLVGLVPIKGKRNLYHVDLYLESEDRLYVIYDAVDLRDDGTKATYPEHKELCRQVPVFEEKRTIDEVLKAGQLDKVFYCTPGKTFATSKVYVPSWIIHDTRRPQQFYYSVKVEIVVDGESKIYFTPAYYADVLNKNSLLPHESEEYVRGDKIINKQTAAALVSPYIPKTLKDLQNATYTYSVVCSNPEVRVTTRPDGLGPIYARTTQNTGEVSISGEYNVFYEDKEQVFSFSIELIYNDTVYVEKVYESKIRKSTGQVRLSSFGGVFSGVDLTQEELAMSYIRVRCLPYKDNTLPKVDLFVSDINGNLIFGDRGEIYFSYKELARDVTLYGISRADYHYYALTYAVRPDDRKRIKLLPPLEDGPFESWYLRIQSGMFTKDIVDANGNRDTYVYFLPEYERQPYSGLGQPWVKVENERPVIESKYTVRVRRTPLRVDDATPLVVMVNGRPMNVIDVDLKRGIIELEGAVMETDFIEVSYYYKETCLTYKGFTDDNGYFWFLDVNPGLGHNFSYVNKSGAYRTEQTFKLLNRTIYVYLKPAGRLDTDGNLIPDSFNPNCIVHSFEPVNITNAILIGTVSVRPHLTEEGLKLIDTRTRGGGVKPELLDKALEIEPASEYYWDIGRFDGQPWMEAGVGVIRAPKQLLKEFGGRFTKEDVEAVVNKYLGWGTLPIIEYVDRPEFLLQKPMHPTIEIDTEFTGALKPQHPTVKDAERTVPQLVVLPKPDHLSLEIVWLRKEPLETPVHPTAKKIRK